MLAPSRLRAGARSLPGTEPGRRCARSTTRCRSSEMPKWRLSETGWVEGQNLAIEYRWAEHPYDRLPALAADLVGRKVDLIVAAGGFLSALAAKGATSTIPIVFTGVSDPVGAGLVASLARPGGNITGFSPFQLEMMPKRLELLTELVPQAGTIALLVNPNDPNTERVLQV